MNVGKRRIKVDKRQKKKKKKKKKKENVQKEGS